MGGVSDIVGSVTGGLLGTGFETVAPTAVPESFGGQALGEAIGQGAEIQGQSIQDAIAQQQASLGQAGELFGQTAGQFDPFIQGGGAASQQQAALSGALGPQAQQQAFTQFQASPGQQYLQQQGERALLRNRAATGDLGGGRTQQALQQQGIGFAQQDFGNQFARLGQVAGRGLGATQALGGLRQGFAQQGLGAGQNIGNLQVQGGQVAAGGLTGEAEALRQEKMQQFNAANIARGQEVQNLQAQQAAQSGGIENLIGLGSFGMSYGLGGKTAALDFLKGNE
jgi:hypothetical protein